MSVDDEDLNAVWESEYSTHIIRLKGGITYGLYYEKGNRKEKEHATVIYNCSRYVGGRGTSDRVWTKKTEDIVPVSFMWAEIAQIHDERLLAWGELIVFPPMIALYRALEGITAVEAELIAEHIPPEEWKEDNP